MPPTRHAARAHVHASRPRFRPSQQECERLAAAFGVAAQSGDTHALAALLAQDVTFYSDTGGKVPGARRPVVGRDKVMRLISGLTKKGMEGIRAVRAAQINGAPGFILERDSGDVFTLAFDFRDGVIANVYGDQPRQAAPCSPAAARCPTRRSAKLANSWYGQLLKLAQSDF
jgi:RNA polymerase sigma-70 factor, ECF subfamily